jgi:hypothetical protein
MSAATQDAESAATSVAYRAILDHLFAGFNVARVLAYLPTAWAVAASGDSNQHSLWTWLIFLGGNASMALWLWENNGRCANRAIVTSSANAVMCTCIVGVIAWTRL